MPESLEPFLIPILSGLRPAPECWGRLSREAEAEVEAKLAALRSHRAHALVSSRDYIVMGRVDHAS